MTATPCVNRSTSEWRQETLRKANVEALCEMTMVLRHLEEGNYLEEHQVYEKITKAASALSLGLRQSVEE